MVIVLDSVGIGNAVDADRYGDEGANTLAHIFERIPDLQLPNLTALGLGEILGRPGSSGEPERLRPRASHGRMEERSAGKDTTTGHWEIAGVIMDEPFTVFERFPDELVKAIELEADVQFIGNFACSGTVILEKLGAEHLETGQPVLYTSADSVLQIAAHEDVIPVPKLYELCQIARRHADRYRIGRVIARPFEGTRGSFRRTARRHDFSMRPPPTILNAIAGAGLPVVGIGKISDIFAGEGITESHPTISNIDGMKKIDQLWAPTKRGLIFINLVDFDMTFGHRRDTAGYATALLEFDQWLGNFTSSVSDNDLVIITADHGNDPTFRGTDHTREQVPLLVMHKSESRDLGVRKTFADVAASLATFFELSKPWPVGTSFL
ncbi:MAG: phosphopentomutase [Verrucomicrobiota bacterium]|jgi:phosphopentomutase